MRLLVAQPLTAPTQPVVPAASSGHRQDATAAPANSSAADRRQRGNHRGPDPELRAFLEAMEQRIDQRADARDAETRQRVDMLATEIKATRAVAEAALSVAVQARDEASDAREEARQGFEAASREAGALNDKALAAIKALGDGLAMHREAVERHAEDRERDLMNAHVLPLDASAASHEARISTLEKR